MCYKPTNNRLHKDSANRTQEKIVQTRAESKIVQTERNKLALIAEVQPIL